MNFYIFIWSYFSYFCFYFGLHPNSLLDWTPSLRKPRYKRAKAIKFGRRMVSYPSIVNYDIFNAIAVYNATNF
jgi:hypothetical protein